MNFCRLPPGQALGRRQFAGAFDLEIADRGTRRQTRDAALDQTMTHHSGARAGQERIVGQRHGRHRAASQSFFRNEA